MSSSSVASTTAASTMRSGSGSDSTSASSSSRSGSSSASSSVAQYSAPTVVAPGTAGNNDESSAALIGGWDQDEHQQIIYFVHDPARAAYNMGVSDVKPQPRPTPPPPPSPLPQVTQMPEVRDTPIEEEPAGSWNDVWAAILFLVNLVGVAVVLGTAQQRFDEWREEENADVEVRTSENADTLVGVLGTMTVLAAVIGGCWLAILRACSRAVIYAIYGFALLCVAAFIIVSIAYEAYGSAVLGVIFLAIFLFLGYAFRDAVKITAELIRTASMLVPRYWGTIVTVFVGTIINIAYQIAIIYAIVLVVLFQDENVEIQVLFLIFSLFWGGQVVKNVAHTVVAGAVASWYYLGGTPFEVKSPAPGAAKRAMTTSFGSICLGSLIVAVIKFVRVLLQEAAKRYPCLVCIIDCVMGIVQNLVERFNEYAYCQVAIYGKAFIPASKATWKLVKESGFLMYANAHITGFVLGICSFTGGVVCLVFALIWTEGLVDDGSLTSNDQIVAVIVAFVLGMLVVNIITSPIYAAIVCLFVSLAEAPQLAAQHPDEFLPLAQVLASTGEQPRVAFILNFQSPSEQARYQQAFVQAKQ